MRTSARENPRKSLLESWPELWSGRIARLRGRKGCSFPDRMGRNLGRTNTPARMAKPTQDNKISLLVRDRVGPKVTRFGSSVCPGKGGKAVSTVPAFASTDNEAEGSTCPKKR